MLIRAHNSPLQKLERSIRKRLNTHLKNIGISNENIGNAESFVNKEMIRSFHYAQRFERLKESAEFLNHNMSQLLPYFASGQDVCPEKILPRLELVHPGTEASKLFRIASLTWSIPVSEGYGRRLRFIVWDANNSKIIGLIALGDPVFNLRVRDELVGWDADDRKDRLVCVMDAYVLGALPPYNMLLAGKLVACLIRTREVRDIFNARYGNSFGVISGRKKHAKLVMVTTTSALGRSSVYNRLRLSNTLYFEPIGYTAGFGHFHVPDLLFEDMRKYLRIRRNIYADGNKFGQGPNWKFRSIRACMELIGINREVLHHGIKREVFVCRLAQNAYGVLRGEQKQADYKGLLSVDEVGELALARWIHPRASRRPEFREWNKENIVAMLRLNADQADREM